MDRRTFIQSTAATTSVTLLGDRAHANDGPTDRGLTYASPAEAMRSPRETLAYVTAVYTGTPVNKPDYLATVDLDPDSPTYAQVIHRTSMLEPGDELHHFGWNACSSCHGDAARHRRYLIVPGLSSGNIHVLDTANRRKPERITTIAGEMIRRETNLSAPHTVHCLSDGSIMVSMLGDGQGNAPGGFLLLSADFKIQGRWEKPHEAMKFSYDFWYQPRHNVMISSEWAAPNTVRHGFKLEDVLAGKYGQRLHFWDWGRHELSQSIDLGEAGRIPLECRFHHQPDSAHGFVGAALSSVMWHYFKQGDEWKAEKVIQVDPMSVQGWPFPVPGLITDLVLSMDDRFLYLANWLHGDVRQYDVQDPARPRFTGQVWLGGVVGKGAEIKGKRLAGGPQMLQLSLDGRRLYVTNSLYSAWDNQFYPEIGQRGSYLAQINCYPEQGGMAINPNFLVDFGREPDGPSRAHEIRFPDGDCTSDIWM
jgi:selenium-binding protein 1